MSAIAMLNTPITQARAPSAMERWSFLIPTITAIALGSFFIPHFALGLAVGTAVVITEIVALILLRPTILPPLQQKRQVSQYHESIIKNPVNATLLGPIFEEVLFRGIILPALFNITKSVPFAAIGSGLLFGAAHLNNRHDGAQKQAIVSAIWGTAIGFFSVSYGLGAAIAAHIANNTIATSLSVALSK